MVAATRRRSPRLVALEAGGCPPEQENPTNETMKEATTKRRKKAPQIGKDEPITEVNPSNPNSLNNEKVKKEVNHKVVTTLSRTREEKLKKERPELTWIMGIDEAGRGPLAGPVVAAAAVVPSEIAGITDSKKITCENAREALYEQIVKSPNVTWAVAIVDNQRIDEINILQATMEAMSMAAGALIHDGGQEALMKWEETSKQPACASRKGCYVACGGSFLQLSNANSPTTTKLGKKKQKMCSSSKDSTFANYYALVDGNRVPKDLTCDAESIVKGDSKEYSIAAASILAKVTRDRLMHSYDALYPEYNLSQHKGYPTKDHMAAVLKLGASPIHRRTFAPLKHMEFDAHGKVIGEKPKDKKKKLP